MLCQLARSRTTLSAASNWTVDEEKSGMDKVGETIEKSNNFTFPTSLDIFLDTTRQAKQDGTFSVKQVKFHIHLRPFKLNYLRGLWNLPAPFAAGPLTTSSKSYGI